MSILYPISLQSTLVILPCDLLELPILRPYSRKVRSGPYLYSFLHILTPPFLLRLFLFSDPSVSFISVHMSQCRFMWNFLTQKENLFHHMFIYLFIYRHSGELDHRFFGDDNSPNSSLRFYTLLIRLFIYTCVTKLGFTVTSVLTVDLTLTSLGPCIYRKHIV